MAARRCVNARPHKDDNESDEAWGSEVPTSLSCLVDKLRECLRRKGVGEKGLSRPASHMGLEMLTWPLCLHSECSYLPRHPPALSLFM